MRAVYVGPFHTPLSLYDAATALRAALSAGKSELVRDDVLALALAKTALETGRWRSCWNFNFGNVKAGENYVGLYTCIDGVSEIIDGRERFFGPRGEYASRERQSFVGDRYDVPPGHPQSRFRAYANRYDGAYAYVEALVRLFPRAYEALWGGDAAAFVRALKGHGYFTAAEGPYARAVASLQHEFMRAIKGNPVEESDHDWDDLRMRVAAQQYDPFELARESEPEKPA